MAEQVTVSLRVDEQVLPKPQTQGEARRAQILTAALRLFSERGYRETSTAALAAAVGVSEAALYKHFRSKEEIFAALVERETADLSFMSADLQLEGLRAQEVFLAVASQVMRVYAERPAAMRLILSEGLRDPLTAGALYDRLLGPAAENLENFIGDRVQSGELQGRPGIAAPGFLGMLAFYMMVTELVLPLMGRTGRFTSEEVATELVRVFVKGLLRAPAPAVGAGSTEGKE